jgi:hypothetical protein
MMSDNKSSYIGEQLEGIGYVSGYCEKTERFLISVTYCDHISIHEQDFYTLYNQLKIKKEVSRILNLYKLEVPVEKSKSISDYSNTIIYICIVVWLSVLTLVLFLK